jgi:hypothetical protein
MLGRFFASTVATIACCGGALSADASFHCVVKSAYYADRGDQPIPNKRWNWEGTKVDVLIHNGKALVTHQLFGFTNPATSEFAILQEGGAKNSWRLLWDSGRSPFADVESTNTILIYIRTWGLKSVNDPIRFYLDYAPDIMLGTCDRTAGELGFDKE